MNLDLYDKRLLFELDKNARSTASSLSKIVKLPKETVHYRIKRLIKNNYITHFYTIINASKLGYQYYRVFVGFHKLTLTQEKNLINFLLKQKSCANLRILEGTYDLVFLTTHKNPKGLRLFINKFLDRFGMVIQKKSIHTITSSYKYPNRIFFGGKTKILRFNLDTIERYELNEMDTTILSVLSFNSRIPLTKLSRQIKKDVSTVRYHLKKLHEKGIIVAFTPTFNYGKIAREHIQIDISIRTSRTVKPILEFFNQTNLCLYAYELIGKYDLSVEIIVKDDHELRSILHEFREKYLEYYNSYDVSHIYSEYIPTWSPFVQ